jgi:hypothetical protein
MGKKGRKIKSKNHIQNEQFKTSVTKPRHKTQTNRSFGHFSNFSNDCVSFM